MSDEKKQHGQGGAAAAAHAATNGAAPAAATEKKLSPKNKITRGIPADWKTTYVDFNQKPEDNETINRAAKQRGVKVGDLLRGILDKAVAAEWAAIQEDASKYVPTTSGKPRSKVNVDEMTPEAAEKYAKQQEAVANAAMARAKEAAAKAKAMLEKSREKATATA